MDHAGRAITGIIQFDDIEMERVHDYIQWLFPLAEKSQALYQAPVLTADDIETIRSSPECCAALRRSADRMKTFYTENRHWMQFQDHNHLRITRIIKSLRLLVSNQDADDFRRHILDLVSDFGAEIDPIALRYWQAA